MCLHIFPIHFTYRCCAAIFWWGCFFGCFNLSHLKKKCLHLLKPISWVGFKPQTKKTCFAATAQCVPWAKTATVKLKWKMHWMVKHSQWKIRVLILAPPENQRVSWAMMLRRMPLHRWQRLLGSHRWQRCILPLDHWFYWYCQKSLASLGEADMRSGMHRVRVLICPLVDQANSTIPNLT